MSKALPKAVIFDLDGTLVDSVPDLTTAVNLAFAEIIDESEYFSQDQIRLWVGNGSRRLIERAICAFGKVLPIEQLHSAFLKHYKAHHNNASRLYKGVITLLTALKKNNINIGLVTNKPVAFVPSLLQALKIGSYFDIYLGGDSLEYKKPHPEPLQHCLSFWKLSENDVVMVGDSESDALAAQAANIPCIMLKQGYNQGVDLNSLPAESVLDDINALHDYWFPL
ncbi:phosphoglycolate phosphatase [Bermanella marisrubri]|uniref:phosphoglycolate phosphatase n=1 Tax=Bermanella marisrubri TaxID=207949 RepID=Q1N3R0_9GAMM|nr:phosphoglycolate phosphatase [Bermanella marisrubri]EAT12814.1 phosphoglycolate phosphatase [Oceanobacter sp. RED65] [Bermanella marisrubri]QIZ83137.1 phosphoglycolate phosphatase [Bermanella marisrubri]